MARYVHKYGGTSVGSPERIQAVARRIAGLRAAGHDLVVVVSAMGHTTDELLALAARITDNPHRREMDMLLSAGERIAMALLSMALNHLECPAISFTGSQSGIITDSGHGRARILEIRPVRIRQELERGRVVIVAGFQGVSRDKEVTTLGRGGSDTTAVALAVAFEAAECAIYTDVDGVMSADPRLVPAARLLPSLDFDTMLEFSSRGAGVINHRAVELARKYRMPLTILNSLREAPGTRIEEKATMESQGVIGVTGNDQVVGFHLADLHLEPRELAVFLERLNGLGLEVTGLHQYGEGGGVVGLSFLVNDLPGNRRLYDRLETMTVEAGGRMLREENLAAVSIVSSGSIPAGPLAHRVVATLAEAGVSARSFGTSLLSLTVMVPRGEMERAVRVLHERLVADEP